MRSDELVFDWMMVHYVKFGLHLGSGLSFNAKMSWLIEQWNHWFNDISGNSTLLRTGFSLDASENLSETVVYSFEKADPLNYQNLHSWNGTPEMEENFMQWAFKLRQGDILTESTLPRLNDRPGWGFTGKISTHISTSSVSGELPTDRGVYKRIFTVHPDAIRCVDSAEQLLPVEMPLDKAEQFFDDLHTLNKALNRKMRRLKEGSLLQPLLEVEKRECSERRLEV